VPLLGIVTLSALFIAMPEQSQNFLYTVRSFLGDGFGLYYILLGVLIFGTTIYIAFSKYGSIRLGGAGNPPAYSNFTWGAMIFTSTMAADIIFFSLSEWAMYAAEPRISELGDVQLWSATFPLFHWGPIAWSFYIVLAVALGFMLHNRGGKGAGKQKFSEACRPILGSYVDGIAGRAIDLTAIFALLAGTATTFSLATPLISGSLARIFGLDDSTAFTIIILITVAVIYTTAVVIGMKAIAGLAKFSVHFFSVMLLYFLLLGGETRFILESGVSALGNLAQNFVGLATWADPMRQNSFPQNWTIFYWAYWMAWCVATPFFVGMISRGRTIKNVVLGGYAWGLTGTFTSFIILGGYGMAQQFLHGVDTIILIYEGVPVTYAILGVFETLPFTTLALLMLALNMIIFYATTFDALTMVVSKYSYKELHEHEEPSKKMRIFWSVLFIILPTGLIFSESALHNLQSVAIIAAFPIGIIILLIVASFFKDAQKLLQEENPKLSEGVGK